MTDFDARPTSHRGLAVALLAAPVLWLLAEVVSPALKSNAASQLAVVAAHPDRWYVYTVLLLAGTIAFVPAVLGVMRLLRPAAPRLATICGVLLGFGTIVAVGDTMTQLMTWQMVKGGADRAQMAALLDRFDNAGGAGVIFGPGGVAFLLGALVLAFALLRTRVAPVWAGVAFGVALIAQIVGFTANSRAIIAASAVILLAAAGPLSKRLFTESNAARSSARPGAIPTASTVG